MSFRLCAVVLSCREVGSSEPLLPPAIDFQLCTSVTSSCHIPLGAPARTKGESHLLVEGHLQGCYFSPLVSKDIHILEKKKTQKKKKAWLEGKVGVEPTSPKAECWLSSQLHPWGRWGSPGAAWAQQGHSKGTAWHSQAGCGFLLNLLPPDHHDFYWRLNFSISSHLFFHTSAPYTHALHHQEGRQGLRKTIMQLFVSLQLPCCSCCPTQPIWVLMESPAWELPHL